MNKPDETITDLIEQLENPSNIENVKNAELSSPLEDLGKNIWNFFLDRLRVLEENEDFKKQIELAILKKIESSDVKFSELSHLLVKLTEQTSVSLEQIVNLVKPPQSNNPISPITGYFNKLSISTGNPPPETYDPKIQEKADILYRLLQALDRPVPSDSQSSNSIDKP